MIIFDLDGTLADCEHRRHFVDPTKRSPNGRYMCENVNMSGVYWKRDPDTFECTELWKPNWNAFYEACDQDRLIEPVALTMRRISQFDRIEIWSGRSESVKEKTVEWIYEMLPGFATKPTLRNSILKMRPIGDYTPDDQLKERWLDEYLRMDTTPNYEILHANGTIERKTSIEFVFDDRPKVIRMWRRRGIFVFNCNQKEGEF